MGKRKLKRQLNLGQVVMLGTAGTIAAEIFVLTGHAAGMSGPAAVLAMLMGGLLSYAVALNYCELGTAFPEAGGAMSYVREAFGNGLLSYLVGSMDCLSSTFYAALSAVGFAYSLQVLVPAVPIVPVAIATIILFTLLNIRGVTKVGNVQMVLGGILLLLFLAYIIIGFIHPKGFSWQVFMPEGKFFIHKGLWANLMWMLATIALTYNAYVGFEVIVDDAEEVSEPSRTIPRGILLSLTLTTIIYVLVTLVTLGTIPWYELAGSETALTDAVRRFIPGLGVPIMAFLGMIATLTSVNSAMLSATREAFTLGRDGVWPHVFSKLSRFRTPYAAILVIGAISALIAAIGLVDFLSYISSSGYLFVLFWGSLSLLRLRKLYPNLERPFRVPFYPLTIYIAGAACVLIVAFADWRAILFGASVLTFFTILRYAGPPVMRWLTLPFRALEPSKDRILIAAANPKTARSLVHLASIIAEASEDTYACVLTVRKTSSRLPLAHIQQTSRRPRSQQQVFLEQILDHARFYNLALYTKLRTAPNIAQGILDEVSHRGNVKLLLMGWPGPLSPDSLSGNPVKVVLQKAPTNVAVLLDRGLEDVRRILVPVGGGPHSRLAIRLAYEIAVAEGSQITALRLLTANHRADSEGNTEEIEDQKLLLAEIIEEVLGYVPGNINLQVKEAPSIPEGVLAEISFQPYDLIVMGASEEWSLATRLFGSVDDWVADHVPCSALFCRRYEAATISWIRRHIKLIEHEYDNHTTEIAPAAVQSP